VVAEVAPAALVFVSAVEAVVDVPARSVGIAAAVVDRLVADMNADTVAVAREVGRIVAEMHQYDALVVLEVPCTAQSGQSSRRPLDLTTPVRVAVDRTAAVVLSEEVVSIVDDLVVYTTPVGGNKDLMEPAERCNSFLVQKEHNWAPAQIRH